MTTSSVSVATSEPRGATWSAWCAVATLWILSLLAFLPEVSGDASITLTFFCISLMAILACWTPLSWKLQKHQDVATFCVTLCMFLIYGLARRSEWGITLQLSEGMEYTVSPAAILVLIGAGLSAPIWIRQLRGWANAVIIALLTLGVLGFGSFWFLSQYYTVGPTEILDPTPLLPFAMNLIEFLLLGLVCFGSCAHEKPRKVLLTTLPIFLVLLWGRHAFIHGGGEQ